jgi:hypothetical protein
MTTLTAPAAPVSLCVAGSSVIVALLRTGLETRCVP